MSISMCRKHVKRVNCKNIEIVLQLRKVIHCDTWMVKYSWNIERLVV